MAGRGPAPKDPAERRRRNATPPTLTLADDGQQRGPDLPEGFEWPPQTLAWWETWRAAPQAQTFTATDWDFLAETAVLHAEFWLGNRALAAELRLRVAKFGATPEDRARLRMSVGSAAPRATPAAPARKRTEARRDRILGAVGDD